MPKVLVAYSSRSGVTEELAYKLAKRLEADLLPVTALRPRKKPGGRLKRLLRWLLRLGASTAGQQDISGYSFVVLGSPVRKGRLSTPMQFFLKRFRGQIGPYAAFWVAATSTADKAVTAEMERLAGRPALATVSFGTTEVYSGGGARLDNLVLLIQKHLESSKDAEDIPAADMSAETAPQNSDSE